MTKPINSIVLSFGFAEDSYLSSIVFKHEDGFKSKKEAIKDLANFFFKKMKTRYTAFRPCSCINKKAGLKNKFCAICGHRLDSPDKDYLEEYEGYLRELAVATLNGYGYNDRDFWTVGTIEDLFVIDKSQFFIVAESAEKVLLAAMKKSDVEIDSILARHHLNSIYMNGI